MLIIYVYIAALVLGGCLLCASMFLGHHDAEASPDLHVDGDVHAAADADGHLEAGHGASLSDFWIPFVSVRFWIFFLCFFGLTGSVFSLFHLAGKWPVLILALAVGVATGLAAVLIIKYLRTHEVGQAPTEEDLKGLEGVLLLPLAPGTKSKVRLDLHGQTVDLVAVSDEPDSIETGRRVVVIDIRDNQAVVVSAGSLED
jgi:membrane protein implicated in regulation of membrane protease activity